MRHWCTAERFLFRECAAAIVRHLRTPLRRRPLYFTSRSCARKDLIPSRQALVMSTQFFYAVRKGRTPGIYHTWEDCEIQTSGFPKSEFQKFSTAAKAEAYLRGDQSDTTIKPVVKLPQTSSRGQKRDFASVMDESQWQVVYTDGACKGNGKAGSMAGVGVFWGLNDSRNLAERCPGDQTNNRAELIAIVRVLETAPMTKEKLLIKTDSKYSIDCFERWLSKWMQNDFKTSCGHSVKNAGIIQYLSSLLAERGKRGQQICLQYIRGHSKDPGNDGADAQANIGATLPPLPELDWTTMQSRAGELIESLVPKKFPEIPTALVVDTQPQLSESPERPTKMSKSHVIVSQGSPSISSPNQIPAPPAASHSQIPTHIPFPPTGLIPTRPARSPLRLNRTSGLSPDRPTVYSKAIYQAASTSELPAAPVIQPPLPEPSIISRPQTPPATESNKTLKITNTSASTTPPPQGNHARLNEAFKSTFPPKSPLTVSKVAPPLIPVSMRDVDLNLYKDCLLEGEDWEREIENI